MATTSQSLFARSGGAIKSRRNAVIAGRRFSLRFQPGGCVAGGMSNRQTPSEPRATGLNGETDSNGSNIGTRPEIVFGDLLDQSVDVIVNPWNRNVIPWWLLLPQGVSGAIKRRAGLAPFRELGRTGPLPLGHARLTGAGRLPFRGIVHVAGINMFWRASPESVCACVMNAMKLINEHAFTSVAFPLIGAGSGGMNEERSLAAMMRGFGSCSSRAAIVVVRWAR